LAVGFGGQGSTSTNFAALKSWHLQEEKAAMLSQNNQRVKIETGAKGVTQVKVGQASCLPAAAQSRQCSR
jgi:hypothetical protein